MNKADNKADNDRVEDRKETPSLMEPLLIGFNSSAYPELAGLSFELGKNSAAFVHSIPPNIQGSLASLVRSMNCYYSNLIEGNYTHPIDIERALKADYNHDSRKRDLQLEAKAHISVQQWMEQGGLQGRPAASVEVIRQIHQRFYEGVPDSLRWVEQPETKERLKVIPGQWREHDVQVGRHIPVSPGAIPRFMLRFEEVYSTLGPQETLIAAAAAHHRLAWIHPFLDGNGRVMRLLSHAMLSQSLDTGSLWSISRGLARRVQEYKSHLDACDQLRLDDLDGRGQLSQEKLVEFTRFFLETCLDQVSFMKELVDPERLKMRILSWNKDEVQAGRLPAKSDQILQALLYRNELPRGEVPALLGVDERQGRRVISALSQKGVVVSDSSRAPLRLAFPAALAWRWMPGLFPEKNG